MVTKFRRVPARLSFAAPRVAAPAGWRSRLAAVPPTLALGIVVVALVLAWAIAPAAFVSADPIAGVASQKLSSPSGAHLLGTDYLGRDMLSRIVHGARTSVLCALLAVGVAVVVGLLLGVVAGLSRPAVDSVLMRAVDVLLAIPSLLLAMVLVAAFGFSSVNAAFAVGLAQIANFARVSRAETMRVRRTAYVEAASLAGARRPHVVFGHVLPNIASTVIALAVLEFGFAVLAISTLSFLGFGTPPPLPEWGKLVAEGADYFYAAPWLVIAPAAVIVLLVLSVNRIANAVDARTFDESL